MKKIYAFIVVSFCFLNLHFTAISQNLVPNPSFEQYDTCPYSALQLHFCTSWSEYRWSPEYFNSCADSGSYANIPYTMVGFQNAADGNGMAGIICYAYSGLLEDSNFREIIGCHLLAPLQVGTTYYISFKANMAIGGTLLKPHIASNGLGIKFLMRQYSSYIDPVPIDNNPDIFSNTIIADSINWTTISGSFLADSAYQYLAIGNFFDDSHTDTLNFGTNFNNYSYYFIDELCVSDKIDGCMTGINEGLQINNVSPSPNPFSQSTQITLPQTYSHITLEVYNIQGKLMAQYQYADCDKIQLMRNHLNSGLYFLKLTLDDGVVMTGKVVVE